MVTLRYSFWLAPARLATKTAFLAALPLAHMSISFGDATLICVVKSNVFDRDLADADGRAGGGGTRVRLAPREREHLDLVAVTSVEALAGDAVDLQEVVGHRARLTQRRHPSVRRLSS